jgi:hypothetical protein
MVVAPLSFDGAKNMFVDLLNFLFVFVISATLQFLSFAVELRVLMERL